MKDNYLQENILPKTISDLIIEYFKMHPKKDLKHDPVVDWVTSIAFPIYYCNI